MAILFSIFLAVAHFAGWIDILQTEEFGLQVMVWRCVAVSLVFGFAMELFVGARRLHRDTHDRAGWLLRRIATNWVLALGASAILFVLLGSSVLDGVKVVPLVVSAVVVELVVVSSIAGIIEVRAQQLARTRSTFLRGFGNYMLLNVGSMTVGVATGRLYLSVAYPGVG